MTHKSDIEAAYALLNRAEHHPLPARLAAIATIFKHGTAGGIGSSAALDRMAQGIAFLCEAATPQVRVVVRFEGTRLTLNQLLDDQFINIHHVYVVGAKSERRVTSNPGGLHHLADALNDAQRWADVFGCAPEVEAA